MNLFENIQLSLASASVLAFIVSLFLNFLFINLNSSFAVRDTNQKRLNNLSIIPLGGVAMSVSFFICVRFLGEATSSFLYISIFSLAIALMGVVDDFYNLNWKIKLILQILFVGFPVITLKFYINIENILNLQLNNYLNIFATVIWVILLMNSINFTDNMDGFAALNTSFICLALGIISFAINQNYLADLSIVLLFSILGFLLLNYPPAKIYMGDSGSLFIGYVLGFISIIFDWNPISDGNIYDSFAPVLLFFTIPLLDFTTVFTYRIRNRISPTTGGTDHISHRLLKQGFSVQKILFIFFCINFLVFAILSASIIFNELTIYFIIFYLIFVIYLFLKFSKMEILD